MATYEKATSYKLDDTITYAQGGIISKQVTKNKAGNITLFSFDKDQALTEHTSPYDAFVQILDGEAEIRIDGQPHVLKKGECIIMPADHPHALKATQPFKMLLTMIRGE
ncbi:MAG TPA: cupin domain-containing protein [Porphyromonadaceae bacterium]|jgi:quercetin dioxygenase-like cupin family protein|uniref:cupin domain-containing protein n=1 Tax=Limibacterium fermenti TaxID=3229863 RepID=UPI000E97D540|nr:cupin domain-containing protein [Porphyromonadaceae bacterium]HBK30155.1 cupin domain-containing protein [Porphyromonadaceae bacterium]HBL33626.1 cupin domain-containing protein [Porphyromonadaceae bacterium]HBX45126.1 cupin domain-containing protein [Porphyromonadaceae bacterium]HCM19361.1 cupin domain-containing protein [Porphyromonadaceae bacterium]